ncbi:MAG: type I pullulanase [Ignavibacteriaceae bacterium]
MFVRDKTKIVKLNQTQRQYLKKLDELDRFYSDKKLGSFTENGKTIFRLFAPSAESVKLVTFSKPESKKGSEYLMDKDSNGVWEAKLEGELFGLFYGYKVSHKNRKTDDVICVDPYSKAVTSYNTYFNPRRSVVVKENDFDWEGDSWIQRDWSDLIIYEMHIRDMTAHPSSGAKLPGTYQGLVEKGITGGIDYIKSLGVNTVELLPAQEFGNFEAPFNDSLNGKFNTWNPYEKNHWGYMTAAFFAPESYYSYPDELKRNTWIGQDARQIHDFKNMVKAFHKEGIAVIMDVVYNHISEYEIGNFKEIDKEYYFRLDANGSFIAESFCGNDFKTERPMVRRLIVESVLYWMKEYHIDGFRFDLGKLIDWETIEEIIHEAKKINPYVIFVCEPWGGGYDPNGFSVRGWGAWNDQIRNGIKGENPVNGLGWIFGKWYGNNSPERIRSYVNGTLTKDSLGLFVKKEHSVNYLESHDGYTLGDFIRIATGAVKPDQVIIDADENAKLSDAQLKLNKLAALFLFTCRGITMIHAGQEFARSKVIFNDPDVIDPEKGRLDHNSYNKDNPTNYLNYNHAQLNNNLLSYYKGLIKIRNKYEAFRNAKYDDVNFIDVADNQFALAYSIDYKGMYFIVLFNANPGRVQEFKLPAGKFAVIADGSMAGTVQLYEIRNSVIVPESSGMILKRIKL